MIKRIIYRNFFVLSICLTAMQAIAQNTHDAPTTPSGHLARSAGAYLGAIEWFRTLHATPPCNRILPKNTLLSYEQIVLDELLTAFPINDVSEAKEIFFSMKQTVIRESERQVSAYIKGAFKKYNNYDTACGVLQGAFSATISEAKNKWLETRRIYGRNKR